jgi:hypothetical protein
MSTWVPRAWKYAYEHVGLPCLGVCLLTEVDTELICSRVLGLKQPGCTNRGVPGRRACKMNGMYGMYKNGMYKKYMRYLIKETTMLLQ